MKNDINLRHFAHLVAVCDNNFSVSVAANCLNMAQSVVSRNIQSLEQSLGGPLFIRHGRRLTATTPLCDALLARFRDINMRLADLYQVAAAVRQLPTHGEIRIACTHLQARYILPQVLKEVHISHPRIKITIQQCFPQQINEMLVTNQVDLGICSEAMGDGALMRTHEAYCWQRAILLPAGHELIKVRKLTLKRLAAEPTITYVHGITGRRQYDNTFAEAGLYPNVIIEAADSDVIKEFTRRGLGIGIISSIAYDPLLDSGLVVRKLPEQFGSMRTMVVHRRERILNDAIRLFIEIFCHESSVIAKSSAALIA